VNPLVCPNDHSETFTDCGGMTTAMGIVRRVDNQGKEVEYFDPYISTRFYRCDVCGERVARAFRNGEPYEPPVREQP